MQKSEVTGVKTKVWILLLGIVLLVCVGLSFWLLLPGEDAAFVEVYSDGKLLYTLPLHVDTQIQVASEFGTNTVTVKAGKVAVTQADCPDGYCMDRGFCSSGAQIVCLPNKLVIRFVGEQEVDMIVG